MSKTLSPADEKELLTRQLNDIRSHREASKKLRYSQSKLDKYRTQIEELRSLDASFRDIETWLKKHRSFKVSHSTIKRAFDRWKNGAQS